MRGRVRLQSADRLLQLPLGADPPPAAGLVPRNGDVDEALEEVALVFVRRAPRELELFVCGEKIV